MPSCCTWRVTYLTILTLTKYGDLKNEKCGSPSVLPSRQGGRACRTSLSFSWRWLRFGDVDLLPPSASQPAASCGRCPYTVYDGVCHPPPLEWFSKLDCSATKRVPIVPIPNHTSSESFCETFPTPTFIGIDTIPTWETSTMENRPRTGV